MLIVISGLPGTGKTTVAREVARVLGGTHLSIDAIENALIGAGLDASWTTGVAAYEAARAAAEENLHLGRTVIVDAVNDSEIARETWRRASSATGSHLSFVLLTVPDAAEHRRRLEGRRRDLPHIREPQWSDVQQRALEFEPWVKEYLHLDAAAPLDQLVAAVVALVGAGIPDE